MLIKFISLLAVQSAPLARVHVKFVSPPDIFEHGFTTDGDRTIEQKSFVSIGRRSAFPLIDFGQRLKQQKPSSKNIFVNPPKTQFLRPTEFYSSHVDVNNLGFSSRNTEHVTPDFSNGLDYPDPLLLIGEEAMLAIKYLYGKGELFFTDIPHVRAILQNQEERRRNGLTLNRLGSLRRASPFYT
ncbi:uncharacterized protein [Prorops nasuta]|uniref:uncharacterized protein n=1 Tax=Prorops nasuta TaxID=863751 RepID=UPI0034CD7F92